jgi:hypothetical protein
MNLKKIKNIHPVTVIVFILFFGFLLHNLLLFPPRGSYDASSHNIYAETIIKEKRLPIRQETVHFHNPPTWYFLGVGSIKLTEKLWNITDWRSSIKPWQMTNLFFGLGSLIIWFQISKIFFKKQKLKSLSFIIFLFSFPVFQRVTAMLSVEPVLMFLSSLTLYYYLSQCLRKKIELKQLLVIGALLGLSMAVKITSYAFVITFGSLMCLTIWLKDKQSFIKACLSGLVIAAMIFLISGWFYVYKAGAYGLFTSGRIYLSRIQPESFYFDIPFKLMMNYPVRPHMGNRFIPVLYVDFWGDAWNYFSQTRYGVEIEHIRSGAYTYYPDLRLNHLTRQVRVNLITTFVMLISFAIISYRKILKMHKKRFSKSYFQSLSLFLLFWVSFLGYFYFQSRAPSWDGSNIKPSHLVYIWPIPALFTADFIFSLKSKLLRNILLIILIPIVGLNIWFSWF